MKWISTKKKSLWFILTTLLLILIITNFELCQLQLDAPNRFIAHVINALFIYLLTKTYLTINCTYTLIAAVIWRRRRIPEHNSFDVHKVHIYRETRKEKGVSTKHYKISFGTAKEFQKKVLKPFFFYFNFYWERPGKEKEEAESLLYLWCKEILTLKALNLCTACRLEHTFKQYPVGKAHQIL